MIDYQASKGTEMDEEGGNMEKKGGQKKRIRQFHIK